MGPPLLTVTLAVAVHLQGRGDAVARKLPEEQATNLLRTYLRGEGYDTKGARLDIERGQDPDKKAHSDFYLYSVYVDTPQRLVTIGSYAVDVRTADIWDRMACTRVESSSIASLQEQIREASGLSPSELKRLRRAKPCFDDQGAPAHRESRQ